MNLIASILLITNFFISISILLQEDPIKSTNLSFGKRPFFNSFLEKITFLIIIAQFFFLLIQLKFNLL
jgi:hypothetical protein